MRSWVIASGFASTAVLIGVTSAGGCGGSEDVDRSSPSGTTSGPGSGGGEAGGAGGVAGSGQGSGGDECEPEDFESCDGVYNTCEGDVDEGCDCVLGDEEECFSGDPDLIGIGACVAGTRVCDATGKWSECDGEVLPGAEICNLDDDDCDGAVDEDQGLETCGQGNCTVTVEACIDGVEQECIPLPAGTETCDGSDDDCDGKVDEGCTCLDGQTQSCYTGNPATKNVGECHDGTQTCTAGQWGSCNGEVKPVAETCDGLDNDCDGTEDDNDPEGGAACNTGQSGICAAGTEHCAGGQVQCQQQNQPTTETCNGTDDNCNGSTDEGNPGGGASCNTGMPGVCGPGTRICQGGNLNCVQSVQSSAESCDSLDNDCDGSTDEGNPGGGAGCSTGLPGVCGPGTTSCNNGTLTCNQNTQSSAETCDGLDNDCDGSTDEGNPGGGGSCNTGNLGVCAAGTLTCQGGSVQCVQNVQSSAETCDGVDNDCDGSTDENQGGASCSTGQLGPCAAGTQVCQGGSLNCVPTVTPGVETCDGVDNDCNGTIDNGANACGGACSLTNTPGSQCDGADGDLCNEGTWACSSINSVACSDTSGTNTETCNGLDDDCDGTTDEGSNACGGACTLAHTPATPCDGNDADACNEGSWQCSGLNTVTCNDPNDVDTEICNALDEDCDGNVNEGPCSLANASSTCMAGCVISSCNTGFANCDGLNSTGCELQNSLWSNTAGTAQNLGTHNADTNSGTFCPSVNCSPVAQATGTRGKFLSVSAHEDSGCCADTKMRFELIVPAGVDYDMYLGGTICSTSPDSSATGGGLGGDHVITGWCNDACSGDNDDFTATIEVRWVSGTSCTPWTLNVYAHDC